MQLFQKNYGGSTNVKILNQGIEVNVTVPAYHECLSIKHPYESTVYTAVTSDATFDVDINELLTGNVAYADNARRCDIETYQDISYDFKRFTDINVCDELDKEELDKLIREWADSVALEELSDVTDIESDSKDAIVQLLITDGYNWNVEDALNDYYRSCHDIKSLWPVPAWAVRYVDCYEHSGRTYSVSGETTPDRWDSSPCCAVWYLPESQIDYVEALAEAGCMCDIHRIEKNGVSWVVAILDCQNIYKRFAGPTLASTLALVNSFLHPRRSIVASEKATNPTRFLAYEKLRDELVDYFVHEDLAYISDTTSVYDVNIYATSASTGETALVETFSDYDSGNVTPAVMLDKLHASMDNLHMDAEQFYNFAVNQPTVIYTED